MGPECVSQLVYCVNHYQNMEMEGGWGGIGQPACPCIELGPVHRHLYSIVSPCTVLNGLKLVKLK